MPQYCSLNQLPVELLHILFTYFWTHELLYSFSNVSNYIDTVLRAYHAYRLNFKSIGKVDFHLVCRFIKPAQVISLILSDDIDTPGQSALFFSRFKIDQFIHLRSLNLICIEFDSLKYIFPNIYHLPHLHTLSFNRATIRKKHLQLDQIRANLISHSTYFLLHSNVLTLFRPIRLYANNLTDLTSISLANVRHLKLEKCSNVEVESVFQQARQLKSLDICLIVSTLNLKCNLPLNQLKQLVLTIESKSKSISV